MDEKIIHFVKSNKFIWDKTDKLYKDLTLKDKKWNQLAEKLNLPVENCKKRWKVMRDRYLRVLKQNYIKGRETKYKYYDLLNFLSEGRDLSRSYTINDDRTSTESTEPPFHSITEHSELDNFLGKFYKESTSDSEIPKSELVQIPKSFEEHYEDALMDETSDHKEQTQQQQVETPISCHMRGLGLLLEAANWSTERLLTFQARHTLFILNELKK